MPSVEQFNRIYLKHYKKAFRFAMLYVRNDLVAELTSTSRVGMHRYTFPQKETANVLLDVGAFLGHGAMKSAAIRKISGKEVAGYAVMAPTSRRKKTCAVYFVAQFNRSISEFGGWEKSGKEKELTVKQALEGEEVGGYVRFKPLGFVSTLVGYYPTGGLIARGPSGGNYTYVMVGDQAIPLIAAAYNKGIRDFDKETALEGSVKNAEPGGIRDHAGYETEVNKYMTYYVDKGFVPEGIAGNGGHREGCAMTLFFAYQDWCLSQLAKGMGQDSVYRKYYNRSFNYRYMFDAQSGWMRPRAKDGDWLKDFAPVGKGFNMPGFVESNAAIFTYYVPQNLPDLISMIGGKGTFVNKLSRQFELAAPNNFITPHGHHAQNWVD